MKKAVLTGAGQFGRGVIGMLLAKSGYHVVFADLNMSVVDDINNRGRYDVTRICKGEAVTKRVENISAVNAASPELVDYYESADIICTCAGLSALPKIAPALAESIKRRCLKDERGKINVLACENANGGSTKLKNLVLQLLSREEAGYLENNIGFPDCAIDAIIPPAANSKPADVTAEEYYEWDALKSGFRGELPEINGLNIVDDISKYLERKLFTLNGPNAVTGALGYIKGYDTVQDALKDDEIYKTVYGMMTETGKMLSMRHGFTEDEMKDYRSFIMSRFQNPRIIDSCTRVIREPLRKLAPDDRIVAPMNYAAEYGINTPEYYKGIAAVMNYVNQNDPQSIKMNEMISNLGFEKALESITGIKAGSTVCAEIEKEFNQIRQLKKGEQLK